MVLLGNRQPVLGHGGNALSLANARRGQYQLRGVRREFTDCRLTALGGDLHVLDLLLRQLYWRGGCGPQLRGVAGAFQFNADAKRKWPDFQVPRRRLWRSIPNPPAIADHGDDARCRTELSSPSSVSADLKRRSGRGGQ